MVQLHQGSQSMTDTYVRMYIIMHKEEEDGNARTTGSGAETHECIIV